MKRIGLDVGGTNTDAVLVEDGTVLGAAKTPTTGDVIGGIRTALRHLNASTGGFGGVAAVMIGTTHFVNAVVQRRGLNRAAALRISLPASATLEPMVDWPADLAEVVHGGRYLVHGGHEYDGRPIVAMDEAAIVQAGRSMKEAGVTAAAVTAVFSPLTSECEDRASELLRNEHPDLHVTASNTLARIGLLERENAALLNASLITLSATTIAAFEAAIIESGVSAPLYITQNDGTVVDATTARYQPVFSFASGPTNSMRGAAHLAGIQDAVVADVGGTTTDVGYLRSGYPREANNVVSVGGVRTLFRMPDLLSIGLGGGTVVGTEPLVIGPGSVGHRLNTDALVFGGEVLTMTDVAVRAGILDTGDQSRVMGLDDSIAKAALSRAHEVLRDSVDRMKTDSAGVPLLAVGGGAMLIPHCVQGITEVVRVPHHAVANAVGAAMAQISGEVDHIFRDMEREEMLTEAESMARERAVVAGADPNTLELVEVETIPLAYLPGNSVRTRVKVVGEVAEL